MKKIKTLCLLVGVACFSIVGGKYLEKFEGNELRRGYESGYSNGVKDTIPVKGRLTYDSSGIYFETWDNTGKAMRFDLNDNNKIYSVPVPFSAPAPKPAPLQKYSDGSISI